ncbi:MAG: tRNA 4-thiouridine(8) synthase ThiI [Candidatus Aenigmarchaeota archaeon]|nr:tRNA 4-thiouridine(8) synthase ThiI [Candidatus Aenigmarchaeota archaeon]
MVKAILLFSTGLDSLLAFHLLRRSGVEIIVLVIKTPFNKINEAVLNEIKKEAKVIIYEVKDDYLQIVKNPKFGYGKQVNPCIDCKIYMYKIAKKFLEEEKADFIATGEVLNQRSFSQTLDKLKLIEKEAGVEGLVVRPLSGKLLPRTLTEEKGLIDREKLLDIKGRGRKKQLQLVKDLGISVYSQPAGGCLLTDPMFSKRLKDLMEHNPNFNTEDVELLKIGRHFRIGKSKLILGRDESESKLLEKIRNHLVLKPKSKGPSGIFIGEESDLMLACEVLASYCKDEKVVIELLKNGEKIKEVEVERKNKEEFRKYIIG